MQIKEFLIKRKTKEGWALSPTPEADYSFELESLLKFSNLLTYTTL